MPHTMHRNLRHLIRVGGVALFTGVTWYIAAGQFTGGIFDLSVFAPPGAALGLAAVWAAHAFAPHRFTWQRGLAGALVGGVIVGPFVAFLVAFSAAWDPASFQFVFNVGAWLAFAVGLGVGGVTWMSRWIAAMRRASRHRALARAGGAQTLRGDVIEGTFRSEGDGFHHLRASGRWSVKRSPSRRDPSSLIRRNGEPQ